MRASAIIYFVLMGGACATVDILVFRMVHWEMSAETIYGSAVALMATLVGILCFSVALALAGVWK